jgi:hypothetical protein
MLRAERGLPTRSRRAVVSEWKGTALAFTAPGELSVFGAEPGPFRETGPNKYTATLTTASPFKTKRVRLMTRAIWKMTIEFVYVDHGVVGAFDPVLDPVREHVLGIGGTEGWIVNPKDATPHEQVRLSYQPGIIGGRLALPVRLDVFGVQFYTDLLRRDLSREEIEPTPWPANIWVFD